MPKKAKVDFAHHSPSLTLLVKLGSLIIHTDEAFSPDAHGIDRDTFYWLLNDPEVQKWITDMKRLLPLKRVPRTASPEKK